MAISQSGETADTLEAMNRARSLGSGVIGIVNVVGSTIARRCDGGIYLHAGPEIGVASTKAFTTQLVSLVMLAIHLGRQNGKLAPERARELLAELVKLPNKMTDVVESAAQIQAIARRYGGARGFLFLGRGNQYPIALEGALKLKEISYIHAEGYAAGEMKHGPIALISRGMPIVVVNSPGAVADKVRSNLHEVKARGGHVICVGSDADSHELADERIEVPATIELLSPVLNVLPLQLFAYHHALARGCDIDKPRNLAKSVTVE